MAQHSVAERLQHGEAPLQSVPSADGHPPQRGDTEPTGSPFSIRDLLEETDGLLRFIMRFLDQHAGHDWTIVHVPAENVNGIFCRDCRTGKVHRPDVAEYRCLTLLDSLEGR